MAANLREQFEEKRAAHAHYMKAWRQRQTWLAWLRTLVALLFLAALIYGFSDPLFFWALPLLAIFFVALVRLYSHTDEQLRIETRLVELNTLELRALEGDFSGFGAGDLFRDEHHAYSHDLDLFGAGSIFQLLNRCATSLGEHDLAERLLQLPATASDVYTRQQAVAELAPLLSLRQKLWALGKDARAKEADLDHLRHWLAEPDWVRPSRWLLVLRWAMPALVGLTLLLTFFNEAWVAGFMLLFSIQWMLVSIHGTRISRLLQSLSQYREWLENYARLFNAFRTQPFKTALLQNHAAQAGRAAGAVKDFSALVNRLESRLNAFANAFGNGLFAFDLHSVAALETWRHRHGDSILPWLRSLAEWDAILSLAHFHYVNPQYAFPRFTEENELKARSLGHPLIAERTRVVNDLMLRGAPQVVIITGANMAGKSTFLRAVGVNFALSQTGAPVCAAEWLGPLIGLRSGMRTTDSLQDHQSYFFAELKRLQHIVTELRNGRPMLILLDEILKGTNSDDKQGGSRALIGQLARLPALVLLATHDVALGGMATEQPDRVEVRCFESEIREGQLFFDYRLKPGVAQTRNATYLMRQMGIIPAGK
jgi:hypothetical protein